MGKNGQTLKNTLEKSINLLSFPPKFVWICHNFTWKTFCQSQAWLKPKWCMDDYIFTLQIITSTTMVVDNFQSVQKITKPILKFSKSFVKQTDRQTHTQGLLLKFLRNLKITMKKNLRWWKVWSFQIVSQSSYNFYPSLILKKKYLAHIMDQHEHLKIFENHFYKKILKTAFSQKSNKFCMSI